ncbi:hypothetical protein [Labrys monachus]|uniref:UDP:flavonoid glycosyltransferase YjiC (YdhE family) n=1 Tax=Labrys monachus TaxID=217067 RepID=A0ABU0F805_9HYPH|nr:hypothetical protein [Labrys monachus]MDQ0390571.1 UDP:flavonoid glycosyltransferase YjiC (YdhE family) [Labrys monachus]
MSRHSCSRIKCSVTVLRAGLSVLRTASTEAIRAALARLIAEPTFRAAAGRLGDAVNKEARESTLVAEIEGLAGDNDGLPSGAAPLRILLR